MSSPSCPPWGAGARWRALALAAGLGVAARVPAQGRPVTPAAGSPARTAILDALRDTLRTTSRFKVAHLRTHGAWAFVRAGEVVRDGDAWQETDLFAEALLERRGARWTVVELWSLQDEDGAPRHDAFLGRVRRTLTSRGLPVALLPDDLRR